MWMSVLPTAALFAVVAGVCHDNEINYYDDIGCKPAVAGDDGCAITYDCSSLSSRNQGKCHYKGKEYDIGYELRREEGDPCLAACQCSAYDSDQKVAFNCAIVECPESFHGPPPPGCYRTYDHGKCCFVEDICVKNGSAEHKVSNPVCQYKGKTYNVGEKFYPDEEPCLQCICQPGFEGSFIEPFCKRINCKLELLYGHRIAEGCVPVYYGDKDCCPIGWRCPNPSDTVVPSSTKRISIPGLQCQFGHLKMQVGDRLSSSEGWRDTVCECRLPPHPVCIEKADYK